MSFPFISLHVHSFLVLSFSFISFPLIQVERSPKSGEHSLVHAQKTSLVHAHGTSLLHAFETLKQQTTNNKQTNKQTTTNNKQTTNDKQQTTTNNKQQTTTNNKQETRNKKQETTNNKQQRFGALGLGQCLKVMLEGDA